MDRELWIVDRPGDAWLVNRDGIASDLSLPCNRERGWRLTIHDPRSTIHDPRFTAIAHLHDYVLHVRHKSASRKRLWIVNEIANWFRLGRRKPLRFAR